MKLKKILICGMLSQILLATTTAIAQAPADAVLTITEVTPLGKALVELPNGARVPARVGMHIPNNSQLLVLEKASVKGVYNSYNCEVHYNENTKTQISDEDDSPCVPGALISKSVGNAHSVKSIGTHPIIANFIGNPTGIGLAAATVAIPVIFYAANSGSSSSSDRPISQIGSN